MFGSASFDSSGRYRYTLHRRWRPGPRRVCFCMLNPSTADADHNDPTVRRCIGYAMDWGFDALEVVNIFALRSTDPAVLSTDPDPVGPRNTGAIVRAAGRAEFVVAAWGVHGHIGDRGRRVLARLRPRDVRCLGTTRQGFPKHPLYLARSAQPEPIAREMLEPETILV
jgi:hypothetical protein